MFVMSCRYLKKADAFSAIKEANILEDKLKSFSPDDKEYYEIAEIIEDILDIFTAAKNVSLHRSTRTGHWYCRF